MPRACETELRTLWPRPLLWVLLFTDWMTSCASGPSYGLMVAVVDVLGEVKMEGGKARA